MIRMQLLEAQTRREEVCQIIKNTTDPKDPRHDCREPDMVLTQEEVDFFMRQHRLSFEAEVSQVRVQKSLPICKILNCTTLREYANDGNCYSHVCMSFHMFVCVYIYTVIVIMAVWARVTLVLVILSGLRFLNPVSGCSAST